MPLYQIQSFVVGTRPAILSNNNPPGGHDSSEMALLPAQTPHQDAAANHKSEGENISECIGSERNNVGSVVQQGVSFVDTQWEKEEDDFVNGQLSDGRYYEWHSTACTCCDKDQPNFHQNTHFTPVNAQTEQEENTEYAYPSPMYPRAKLIFDKQPEGQKENVYDEEDIGSDYGDQIDVDDRTQLCNTHCEFEEVFHNPVDTDDDEQMATNDRTRLCNT